MNPLRRGLTTTLAAVGTLTLALGPGCDGGGSPPSVATDTKTEVEIKGTVRLNGKPATGGTVIFDPSNFQRKDVFPREAKIGSDGTYSVKTLVGANRVSFKGEEIAKTVPGAETQRLDVDVKPGESTVDLDLPPKK